jgi:hypothetical protein
MSIPLPRRKPGIPDDSAVVPYPYSPARLAELEAIIERDSAGFKSGSAAFLEIRENFKDDFPKICKRYGINPELLTLEGSYLIRDTIDCNGQPTNPPTLPPIQDAAKFTASKLKAPPELVGGVLHQGCKLALGGGSKTFKTWTLLDLALSVSHGQPWLGFPTKRAPVCYLNFELQEWSIQKRLRDVAQARQIPIEPGWFHVWNLRGHAEGYGGLLPRLASEISVDQLGLLILDPIYKLYGDTDENSAKDISALLNALERLAVDTGAAIAFAAHFSKGNQASKESIDRISGSGCFARDPDAILTFTRHNEENAFTVDSILRNHAPVQSFVVQWDWPIMKRNDDLDPADLKQPNRGGRKKEATVDTLLQCLGKRKLTSAQLQKRCLAQKNIQRASFFRRFGEAKRIGAIVSAGKGKWMVSKVSKVSNASSDTSDTSRSHNPLGYETARPAKKRKPQGQLPSPLPKKRP